MKSLVNMFCALSVAVLALTFSFTSMAADETDSVTQSKKMWKSVGKQTQVTRSLSSETSETSETSIASKSSTSARSLLTVRSLQLDELGFKSLLNLRTETSDTANVAPFARGLNILNTTTDKIIALPLPDGSEVNVRITPSSAMSPALAQQFPGIKTWKVTGVTQQITGTIDFTHHGFHGMLIMPDGDRVFIDPDTEASALNSAKSADELSTQGRYISFSQKQNQDEFETEFSCGLHDNSELNFSQAAKKSSISERLLARPASDVITYRLAIAATGEYSQFHGGTTARALSAITTTINRVNEIFTRDLGIKLELVDEQADIIYLNPVTDPYTNSDVFELIDENEVNLSSAGDLSKDKYDIGHVFGTGNGGLASVGGVCNPSEKAIGATGLFNPIGDTFNLDFVAHELGHQLGGTHTFNSACGDGSERSAGSAVEPGSGSTIMAYPGICQENNIQSRVDSQFHLVSIDQIRTVTRSGGGSSCGARNSSINENPTVNAGLDATVPARTPLVFVAAGVDTDNDDLSYSWEQFDAGTVSDVNVDFGNNALFRSRPLTSNDIRYIPRLNDLFNGTPSDGEYLPVRNRDLNMTVTVRDGKGGLQGDAMKLTVVDTGDTFSVISQTNDQSFGRGELVDILWNVAGTNVPPISCGNVDIGLATANGNGLNIANTANDGQHQIMIPDTAPAMSDARFIVSCSDSNFFNVSSGHITIIDQVGGGSIGEPRTLAANTFSATLGSSSGGSGGGGSFGLFILLWGSLLVCIRERRLIVR